MKIGASEVFLIFWEGSNKTKKVRKVKVRVMTSAEVTNVVSYVAKCPPIITPIAAPAVTLDENVPRTSVNEFDGVMSDR